MTHQEIDTLVFDFGGTLDTNGIHWFNKFYDSYQKHSINITKEEFRNAYIFAERNIGRYIGIEDSFFKTLNLKVTLHHDYLLGAGKTGKYFPEQKNIISNLYNDVLISVNSARSLLEQFGRKYKLALASNFYGNLETVLDELSILKYFSYIFDSAAQGLRKPDPDVFRWVISQLGSLCESSVVIGDSYKKDIEPAKIAGCTTVWLNKQPLNEQLASDKADYIVNSLQELGRLSFIIPA